MMNAHNELERERASEEHREQVRRINAWLQRKHEADEMAEEYTLP